MAVEFRRDDSTEDSWIVWELEHDQASGYIYAMGGDWVFDSSYDYVHTLHEMVAITLKMYELNSTPQLNLDDEVPF